VAEILVIAEKIYTGEEVLRGGYIYVKNGVVVDVGEGPVPEDLTFAALVLGGEGRVAAPGLALPATVAAYPLRYLRPSASKRLEFYRAMGLDAAFAASLPAIYELHIHGVTTVFVEYHEPSLPLKLADSIGGLYGLAIHESWGVKGSEVPPALTGSIVVGGETPLLENPPVFSPRFLDRPWDASLTVRRLAGFQGGFIKKGVKAEIAIFNFSRPPGMMLEKADLSLNELFSLGLRVESLISGEDVLVDGGEHLYIVDKHFSSARRLAGEIGA
jgi:hypothetical protein